MSSIKLKVCRFVSPIEPEIVSREIVLDGRDYGQRGCEPMPPEAYSRMLSDARLIAAAPDMYEALQAYLSAKPQCECSDPACAMEAARIRARAALAKAEGKSCQP